MKEKSEQDVIKDVEYAVDEYIFAHWLEGASLPDRHVLATRLNCSVESLTRALEQAQSKGKVVYSGGTWSAVPSDGPKSSYSFTESAHGRELTTKLIEASIRNATDDHEIEQRVHDALQLPEGSQFIVIVRLRLIDGRPGAFQRVYLNPAHFPSDFLNRHDLTGSLIKIYNSYGYAILSRHTRFSTGFAALYEVNMLNHYGVDLANRAVLGVEQRLFARKQNEESPVILEFLKASYLNNWRYEIKNRPAS